MSISACLCMLSDLIYEFLDRRVADIFMDWWFVDSYSNIVC